MECVRFRQGQRTKAVEILTRFSSARLPIDRAVYRYTRAKSALLAGMVSSARPYMRARRALTRRPREAGPEVEAAVLPRSTCVGVTSWARGGVRNDCSHDGVPVGSLDSVAGSLDQQQLRAWNLVRKRLTVGERQHRIGGAVDDQRRRRDR